MEIMNRLLSVYRQNYTAIVNELTQLRLLFKDEAYGRCAARLQEQFSMLDSGCGTEHPLLHEDFGDVMNCTEEVREMKLAFLRSHFFPILVSFGQLANGPANTADFVHTQDRHHLYPAITSVFDRPWFQGQQASRIFTVWAITERVEPLLTRIMGLTRYHRPALTFGWSVAAPLTLAASITSYAGDAPRRVTRMFAAPDAQTTLRDGLVRLDVFAKELFYAFNEELGLVCDTPVEQLAPTEAIPSRDEVLEKVLRLLGSITPEDAADIKTFWKTNPAEVTGAFVQFASAPFDDEPA